MKINLKIEKILPIIILAIVVAIAGCTGKQEKINWTPQSSGTNAGLHAVYFVSPSGLTFKTTDGGVSTDLNAVEFIGVDEK